MKPLHTVPPLTPQEAGEKDALITRLLAEGQRPIGIDRAVVVVEQCEPGDDPIGGWSSDPLRVTVYPDPDAGFGDTPTALYVHAGRSGLMEVSVTRPGRPPQRMIALDAALVQDATGLARPAAVRALRALIERSLTDTVARNTELATAAGTVPGARLQPEGEELGVLRREALEAFARYAEALERDPTVFRGFEHR